MSRHVGFHIDDHEIQALIVDMKGAPGRLQRAAPKAVRRAAKIIEGAMKQDATGHRHLKQFPSTISSEVLGPFTAEIGFEARGQGRLAHIIVSGSVNNAPVYRLMSGPTRVMPLVAEEFGDPAEHSVFGVER